MDLLTSRLFTDVDIALKYGIKKGDEETLASDHRKIQLSNINTASSGGIYKIHDDELKAIGNMLLSSILNSADLPAEFAYLPVGLADLPIGISEKHIPKITNLNDIVTSRLSILDGVETPDSEVIEQLHCVCEDKTEDFRIHMYESYTEAKYQNNRLLEAVEDHHTNEACYKSFLNHVDTAAGQIKRDYDRKLAKSLTFSSLPRKSTAYIIFQLITYVLIRKHGNSDSRVPEKGSGVRSRSRS